MEEIEMYAYYAAMNRSIAVRNLANNPDAAARAMVMWKYQIDQMNKLSKPN